MRLTIVKDFLRNSIPNPVCLNSPACHLFSRAVFLHPSSPSKDGVWKRPFPYGFTQIWLSRSWVRMNICMCGPSVSVCQCGEGLTLRCLDGLLLPSSPSPPPASLLTHLAYTCIQAPCFLGAPSLSDSKPDLWEGGDDAHGWCCLVLMLSK